MEQLAQTPAQGPAYERLEDQIAWYERKSRKSQRAFNALKLWTMISSTAVPLLTTFGVTDGRLLASITASVAFAEAMQHMNQYQMNWLLYRSTCEALKHEKFLYLSSAGAYETATGKSVLLAERVEELVSQEHARWVSSRDEKKAGK